MGRDVVEIPGNTLLPPGFDHPHASEEGRRIAERGTILRAQVGSGVHGTSIDGQDDRDEMGICLEPHESIAREPAAASVLSPGAAEFARRGRVLKQVIEFAEGFPVKHSPTLRYPRLADLVAERDAARDAS